MEDVLKYAPLATLIVAAGAFAAVWVQIGRWSQRLEARLDRVDKRLDVLSAWALGFSKEINGFFGIIVQMLNTRQQLTTDELRLVFQGLSAVNQVAVNELFQKERISQNPLTPEQLGRLEDYYRRLTAGQILTWEEAQDYNALVSILERERPTDPGVWPLVALGAFILGFALASRPKQ